MHSLSFGLLLLLLLVGTLANIVSTSPIDSSLPEDPIVEAEIEKLTLTQRLSEFPPGTLHQYKYFDLGRGPAGSFFTGVAALDTAVICETTTASPSTLDVVKTLAVLNNMPADARCCQTSFGESRCSRMATADTSALGLCTQYQKCMLCADIMDFLLLLIDNCQESGRIGGKVSLVDITTTSAEGNVMVYHA